jgi:hypothetical protein
VFVDEPIGPFWGCGECGGEWATRKDVLSDVKRAIARYPFRSRVYVKKRNGDMVPVALSREPNNYDALVEKEPIESPTRMSDPTQWPSKGAAKGAMKAKRKLGTRRIRDKAAKAVKAKGKVRPSK